LRRPLAGRRVLVVEDEALIAMELEVLLVQGGAIVLGPVPDIARALPLIERDRPEGAILDVNLNGQLSLPIAEALDERSIPFVVVTGYSASQIGPPLLRDAPRVTKPVDGAVMLRLLGRELEREHAPS
jgi:DNA-binding response OmpR family regulator